MTLLAKHGWPFRLHATYDEIISRALDVFERVIREVPFGGTHRFFDHAETMTDRNVASYSPCVALYWLSTGKTGGGASIHSEENRLTRQEALRLHTAGSSGFSREEGRKGQLLPGQHADLVALTTDHFSIPDEEIKGLESVLTIVGGRVVYGTAEFSHLTPPQPSASPSWSPAQWSGGYARATSPAACSLTSPASARVSERGRATGWQGRPAWGSECDSFVF